MPTPAAVGADTWELCDSPAACAPPAPPTVQRRHLLVTSCPLAMAVRLAAEGLGDLWLVAPAVQQVRRGCSQPCSHSPGSKRAPVSRLRRAPVACCLPASPDLWTLSDQHATHFPLLPQAVWQAGGASTPAGTQLGTAGRVLQQTRPRRRRRHGQRIGCCGGRGARAAQQQRGSNCGGSGREQRAWESRLARFPAGSG